MPRFLPCQQHSPPVRALIARALFSDIKAITGEKSARAIGIRFDPHTFHPRKEEGKEDGKEMDSGAWRKIERGLQLPSKERLQRVTAVYPHADRVTKLRLWPALDAAPHRVPLRHDVLVDMPRPIRKILFEPHLIKRDELLPKVQLTKNNLMKLSRIGTPDALAALLILLCEQPSRLNLFDRILLNALTFRMLVDLMHFTPFFAIGAEFYDYTIKNHFKPIEGIEFSFPDSAKILRQVQTGRRLLCFLYTIGFVNNSFRNQYRMLSLLRMKFREQLSEEIVRLFESPSPLMPHDPFYSVLRELRHQAARDHQPISVPYTDRDKKTFRIGNTLTELG